MAQVAQDEKPGSPLQVEGVACPDCGCRQSEVLRTVRRAMANLRMRKCRSCNRRFWTAERTA